MKKITLVKGRSYSRAGFLFKKGVAVEATDEAADILNKDGRFVVEDIPDESDRDDDFEDDMNFVGNDDPVPEIPLIAPEETDLTTNRPDDLSKLTAADLRAYARGLGINESECGNRQQVEELILAHWNQQEETNVPSFE